VLQGGLIGRLVKRFGEAQLARAGFLSVFVAQIMLGLIHSIPPLLVVAVLSSFGNGVLRPTITSLITRNVGRHEQGTVLGLNQSLNSIAQITAPMLAGFLITEGALPFWAWVAALVSLVGFLVARSTAGQAADKPTVASAGAPAA
jgi:MFS family permease